MHSQKRSHHKAGKPLDLRERLNEIRKNKSTEVKEQNNGPPPDPAYNLLKDPLRDTPIHESTSENKNYDKPRGNKDYGSYSSNSYLKYKRENKRVEEKPVSTCENLSRQSIEQNSELDASKIAHDKQNLNVQNVKEFLKKPLNINVKVSTDSGERKCVLDDSKVIEIPVNNKEYPLRPQFRRQPGEFRKYYDNDDKNSNYPLNKNKNENKNWRNENYNQTQHWKASASRADSKIQEKSSKQNWRNNVPEDNSKNQTKQNYRNNVSEENSKNETKQNWRNNVREEDSKNQTKENEEAKEKVPQNEDEDDDGIEW